MCFLTYPDDFLLVPFSLEDLSLEESCSYEQQTVECHANASRCGRDARTRGQKANQTKLVKSQETIVK